MKKRNERNVPSARRAHERITRQHGAMPRTAANHTRALDALDE